EGERVLAEVEVRLGFDTDLIAPRGLGISMPPAQVIVPAQDVSADRSPECGVELDARSAVDDERFYVTRVERLGCPTNQLDIALRHPRSPLRPALRRETEVGKRAVAVPIDDVPSHLAVADVMDASSPRMHLPDLQSARPATDRK